MKRGCVSKLGVVLLAVVLLVAGTGCDSILLASHSASFAAGWLVGNLTAATTVERQCYENGVLIDCANLPADLGQ
ncbi:MAG: hypothetical protein JXO22_14635 [Phycisphaerae bacterium]|nr:hypothetical protein [Phycisphaerae bacterium]